MKIQCTIRDFNNIPCLIAQARLFSSKLLLFLKQVDISFVLHFLEILKYCSKKAAKERKK